MPKSLGDMLVNLAKDRYEVIFRPFSYADSTELKITMRKGNYCFDRIIPKEQIEKFTLDTDTVMISFLQDMKQKLEETTI